MKERKCHHQTPDPQLGSLLLLYSVEFEAVALFWIFDTQINNTLFIFIYMVLTACLSICLTKKQSMIVEGMLTVDAPIESSRNPLQQILYRPSKGPRPRENRSQRRAYRLFHHCSAREVVIHDKVSTTRNTTDMHGK